jgi:hypothetical protein
VYLGRHEELERDVLRAWRVLEQIAWSVSLLDIGAQLSYLAFQLHAQAKVIGGRVDLIGLLPTGC